MRMNSKTKFFTRKRIFLLAAAVILLILAIFAFDSRLMVRKYTIEAEEIETPVRIALVTDLHSCYYGKNLDALYDCLTEIDEISVEICLPGKNTSYFDQILRVFQKASSLNPGISIIYK